MKEYAWILLWILPVLTLLFFVVRLYVPLMKMEKRLERFRETGSVDELDHCVPASLPQLRHFLERTRGELDLGVLTELKMQRAEYLALQNQINPHFLFNTLEDIRGDALEAGMIGLTQTIGALATYFRYTISETRNLVWLEDEMDNIEDYYTIQRYRFGERITLITELQNEHLGYPKVRIPKLTLQPIVENAFSHGLESRMGKGSVKILIDSTEKDLIIQVSDNGVGMDAEQVERINARLEYGLEQERTKEEETEATHGGKKHTGIALFNVNSRIRLLFGEDYGLHVYSVKGAGTEVEIRIPLMSESSTYGRIDSF